MFIFVFDRGKGIKPLSGFPERGGTTSGLRCNANCIYNGTTGDS